MAFVQRRSGYGLKLLYFDSAANPSADTEVSLGAPSGSTLAPAFANAEGPRSKSLKSLYCSKMLMAERTDGSIRGKRSFKASFMELQRYFGVRGRVRGTVKIEELSDHIHYALNESHEACEVELIPKRQLDFG